MSYSYTTVAFGFLLLAAGTASAGDNKDGNTVEAAAKSTVNEIGKGLEAVGKAVAPAVKKAEKAVRGTAKDETDKRPDERK